MWTSLAPASFRMWIVRRLVVPRTMESSTKITRFPLSADLMGLSLMWTPRFRIASEGCVNVRPTYWFFAKPTS